jgi:PTH1 family peptidyl-tRNA hydrolase
MSPLLAIGLGNPGAEYEDTRHNVGHRVIDALTERLEIVLEHEPDALVGWGTHAGADLGLAIPLTYMNRHLPVGTLRLRPSGSSGGHNGLAHVAQRLGTSAFPRLRVGIGDDFARGRQADYVLSPFTDAQMPDAQAALQNAAEAVLTVAAADLDTAMNQFN